MRAVVLADTHLRPGSLRRLSDTVVAELERADGQIKATEIVQL
ncbi:hypothetical protein BH23ACT1_BH23ACT1_03630 [soil metagenome]